MRDPCEHCFHSLPSTAAAARAGKSILLVFCCTVLGAAAQLLMKIGMTHFNPQPDRRC